MLHGYNNFIAPRRTSSIRLLHSCFLSMYKVHGYVQRGPTLEESQFFGGKKMGTWTTRFFVFGVFFLMPVYGEQNQRINSRLRVYFGVILSLCITLLVAEGFGLGTEYVVMYVCTSMYSVGLKTTVSEDFPFLKKKGRKKILFPEIVGYSPLFIVRISGIVLQGVFRGPNFLNFFFCFEKKRTFYYFYLFLFCFWNFMQNRTGGFGATVQRGASTAIRSRLFRRLAVSLYLGEARTSKIKV